MADQEPQSDLAIDPLASLKARAQKDREKMESLKGTAELMPEVNEAQEATAEERRGLWADSGVGLVRAAPGAVEETFDLLASVDEKMMSWAMDLGLPDVRFGYDPRDEDDESLGFFRLSPEETKQFPLKSLARVPEAGWEQIVDLIPETERASGAVVEGIGKFVAGFMTGKKVLQGVKLLQGTSLAARTANAVVAGGAADAMVFDGHEGRLSDFLVTMDNPALNNVVTQYLATDQDDTELEGRMKNVLEGAGLGILFDGFLTGIRGLRRWKTNQRIDVESKKVTNDTPIGNLKEEPEVKVEEPEVKVDTPEAKVDAEDGAPKVETVETRRIKAAAQIRGAVSLTREQADEFKQAVLDGDDDATQEILKDFNENNIDWSKIESGDDIKRVLLETEKVFADLTENAKGGVQSNEQTKRLARTVNAVGTEVDKLFADVRGGQGIAARFYAAQRIMMASAGEVIKTAKAARGAPAAGKEAAEALRAIQMHAAIQAEVKGAQTEIARALQAMRIIKDSAADNFQEFAELRNSFGKGSGDQAWNKYMDDILNSRSLDELNTKVALTPWERAKAILIEFTINGMLSSPKTHVINLTSNVLNTFIYSADRFLGGSYRYLRHGDRAALREARIDLVSKLTRLDEAAKLARQAWRDGMPVTDVRQRMEFGQRVAIKMSGDSWLAKSVNFLGSTIRLPGRALIAGDEFFKAVTRNSEVSVLAFRQADEEATQAGLKYGSKEYEALVKRRMRQLSDSDMIHNDNQRIQLAARDKSRLTTFQESAKTDVGAGMMHTLNSVPMVKLIIAPFFRTPMNIIRQGVMDRTPLGFLMKEHRRTLKTGHPRDVAEQVARMTTGVAFMVGFYNMVGVSDADGEGGFQVVGKIPYDSSAKLAGVKDYSIRFGDTWYQFSRLEPMGMWMGAIADMKYAMEYADDEEAAFSYAQAAMGAFLNNVTSKTWAQSFTRLLETAEQVQTGKPASVQRGVSQLVAGEFGKLIPQFFKASARALEGDDNSFQKEAWSVLDIMGDRSSMWGKQPLAHDLLGRPIKRDSGLSIVLNPFAPYKNSEDPVDQEFFRLGFTLPDMPKSLSGGVDLTNEEYSKLTGLVAETDLHGTLTKLVTSQAWSTLTDPMKIALLKQQVQTSRQVARGLLLADKGLLKRVTQSKVDAAFLLVDEE